DHFRQFYSSTSCPLSLSFSSPFFIATSASQISTLSLHDALPIFNYLKFECLIQADPVLCEQLMQAKYLQIEFLLHEVISSLILLLTIDLLHKHRHVPQRDDNFLHPLKILLLILRLFLSFFCVYETWLLCNRFHLHYKKWWDLTSAYYRRLKQLSQSGHLFVNIRVYLH